MLSEAVIMGALVGFVVGAVDRYLRLVEEGRIG